MISRREQGELLQYLKVLSDENRLKMLVLLSKGEHRVSDLAAALEITEPTASHHLVKLRSVGLVNLRIAGNQHFSRVNPARLRRFKQLAADIENVDTSAPMPNDLAWVDELNLELSAEDRKVFKDYTDEGRLLQIPAKQKKLLVILRWLVTRFEPGVKYTEKEVNAIISPIHEDYASLRRNLIEFGFLRRERAGTTYWVTPEDEQV
jgi:hypothetical protein